MCDGVWLSVTLYACRSKRWVSFGTGTLQVGTDRHLPFYHSFTHTKLTSCRGPDYIHLATVVEPHLQHCFVLGLGHLMDHNATCSGNDVPQLLRYPHGFGIRHVPEDENICETILRSRVDQAGASTGADEITSALAAIMDGTGARDPWLPDGSSNHDVGSTCDLPTRVPLTTPGAVCSLQNFTCQWRELTEAEEAAAIQEMEAAWPGGDTHNADTEPGIVDVEQFWPIAEPAGV